MHYSRIDIINCYYYHHHHIQLPREFPILVAPAKIHVGDKFSYERRTRHNNNSADDGPPCQQRWSTFAREQGRGDVCRVSLL